MDSQVSSPALSPTLADVLSEHSGGAFLWLERLRSRLFQPVDAAGLVAFRIAFGLIMLWEVLRTFQYERVFRYYDPNIFHFTYFGFDWVKPLPGSGMTILFVVLGVLAVCIAVGLAYRLAALLFFLGFGYVFLLDQAQYLNHFYLVTLMSGLLVLIPAHRAFSLDAWLRLTTPAEQVPAWSYWLLRAQIGIVYFYAGIAKLNVDWLRGEPMRMWLADRGDFPVIGSLFTQEWMVMLFTYGGLLFDLSVTFLLLWRRTRLIGFIFALGFHLMNSQLFNIGIFPWMMIAVTTLFFEPGWIRLPRFRRPLSPVMPVMSPRLQSILLVGVIAYLSVQLIMPLRHWLYPGEVNWTEEGHRFSWHMLLRSKNGDSRFFAFDPVRETSWEIDLDEYLTPIQIDEMTTRPDMLLQFAHLAADSLEAQGIADVQIRVWSMLSLNARASQLMIDPQVDLVREERTFEHAEWILPLMQPPSSTGGVPLLLVDRTADTVVMTNAAEVDFPLEEVNLIAGEQRIGRETWGASTLREGQCIVLHSARNQPPNLICEQIVRMPLDLPELFTERFVVRLGDQQELECPRSCLISVTIS